MLFSKYKYDVFISHAVEDKLGIANDLCKHLEEAGLSIWYSGKRLRVGDSIEEVIFENLPQSRYAVVIFSQHYLSKNWTMKEYYYLQNQQREKRKIILPILYDVTVDHLKAKDIAMADKFAIPFSRGMDHVVEKLLEEIKGPAPHTVKQATEKTVQKLGLTALLLLVVLAISWWGYSVYGKQQVPPAAVVAQVIGQRIQNQQAKMEKEFRTQTDTWAGTQTSLEAVTGTFSRFSNLNAYYRNEYEFSNGYKEIRFKKNVEAALQVDLDALTPYNTYGFNRYTGASTPVALNSTFAFTFANTEPVTYTLGDMRELENGDYEVAVSYTHYLRGVLVNLVFPEAGNPKRCQVLLYGFLPVEKYTFRFQQGQWVWTGLE